MSIDPDKLRARLQALRAKTVHNGCTEEEALSAAAKVAELLDQYGLSSDDLDASEQRCGRLEIETSRKRGQPISACVPAIAEFCDCKVWREKDEHGRLRYVFFGLKPALEMVRTLFEVIDAAMGSAWRDYSRSRRFIRYGDDEKGSFLTGMAVSIAAKLTAMKGEREAAHGSGNGRDLVLIRHAVVEADFVKLNITLRQGGSSGKKVAADAFDAGKSAGRSLAVHTALGEGEDN